MEDSLWQDMWPQSLGDRGFPHIQPPWLSLSCICLCFPSSEPGVFPLSIFSPRTLDHPGMQNRTGVSEAVWYIPGFPLRSVNFWKWFQDGMCCLLRPDLPLRWSCWPASLCMPPLLPLCTPTSPTPASQHPLCVPPFPTHSPAFLPWLVCMVLPSQCCVDFCLFKLGVSKLFFFAKIQIGNIVGFVCCLCCNYSPLLL